MVKKYLVRKLGLSNEAEVINTLLIILFQFPIIIIIIIIPTTKEIGMACNVVHESDCRVG